MLMPCFLQMPLITSRCKLNKALSFGGYFWVLFLFFCFFLYRKELLEAVEEFMHMGIELRFAMEIKGKCM